MNRSLRAALIFLPAVVSIAAYAVYDSRSEQPASASGAAPSDNMTPR
jgi:hypothetical protein